MKQLTLPISEILKPRICLRPVRRKSPEYIELVESIRKDGILQPILVRPANGKYEIVEGWHRYEAAKEVGLKRLPCIIREFTDKEVKVLQIKCNAIRPKTASFEYANRLKELMEDGYTLVELSALVDKTPQWVSSQLYLNRVCEKARKPVERGEIGMKSALALANLPENIQENFIDDAVAMPQNKFVPRAKKALRDYKAFMLQEKLEDKEIGAARPTLRTINVLKKESTNLAKAGEVLKATGAKTPLDGWEACLSWAFKLDPISVKKRKEKHKEKEKENVAFLSREEYYKMNREMIKKFVKSQSRSGDYDDRQ